MESRASRSAAGIARDSQSARKRAAILDAATSAFLESGYVGTSIEQIAVRARVSKPTIYKHFADKEQLFTEIVLRTIDQVGEPFFDWIGALEDADDLEAALGELARKLIGIVREPRLLELRRLVIGETARFPELGRMYFERGPGRTIDALATKFDQLAHRGHLRVADSRLAAQHFNWLVLSIPLNRAMFTVDLNFDATELDRYAQEAVAVFLAAYGQR
jgi:TetR/AcrR family transcriptional repressor of mexJK operon